ncbi:MAG: nickel-dependent lactate racemase [Nitrososphaeria archaeon]
MSSIEVKLRYGNSFQKIEVPSDNIFALAKTHRLPPLANFDSAVSYALENPIGSKRLEEIVSSSSKVAIIIDDITRATPTSRMLPIILNRLVQKGVRKEKIDIVIATGAHLPSMEQVKVKVGENVPNNINIHVHDCLNKNELELIGFSTSGTPIWVNRKILEADIRIGVGAIKPHGWAGFGGGGKIILPGVSSWEAIGRNHFLAASEGARIGNIEDNPLRKDIEEVASKVGLDMIINALLDDNGNLVNIVAGHMIKAHRIGVETVRKMFETKIGEPLDIIIWAFGPEDDNLWDVLTGGFIGAHKKLLKEGGTLILVAECKNGLYKYGRGHLDYSGKIADYSRVIEMLESGMTPQELLSETIRGNMPYLEVGVKAYLLAKLARKCNIIVVSENIKREEISWLGTTMKTAQDALKHALENHGKDAKVGILPEYHISNAYIRI